MSNELTYPVYQRICLRCQRPANGHGYRTLYGSLTVRAEGPTRDNSPLFVSIHACGEIVHNHCEQSGAPRVIPAGDLFGDRYHARLETIRTYNAKRRAVERNIEHNESTGKYYVRITKTNVGTYPTLAAARIARDAYRHQHPKGVFHATTRNQARQQRLSKRARRRHARPAQGG